MDSAQATIIAIAVALLCLLLILVIFIAYGLGLGNQDLNRDGKVDMTDASILIANIPK